MIKLKQEEEEIYVNWINVIYMKKISENTSAMYMKDGICLIVSNNCDHIANMVKNELGL